MTLSCRTLLLAAISILLPGCGLTLLSDRATNPVIEDDATGQRSLAGVFTGRKLFTVISMNAGRRMVLVAAELDPQNQRNLVCAEPPPDALEAYANAVRIEGQATAPAAAGATAAQVRGEAERGFAVSSAPLLYRSQGLQYMRDMLAHLCSMRMNRIITNEEYALRVTQTMETAERLIRAEMPAIAAAAARAPVTVAAPQAPMRAPASPPAAATR